jgi:hypothetical protein
MLLTGQYSGQSPRRILCNEWKGFPIGDLLIASGHSHLPKLCLVVAGTAPITFRSGLLPWVAPSISRQPNACSLIQELAL